MPKKLLEEKKSFEQFSDALKYFFPAYERQINYL